MEHPGLLSPAVVSALASLAETATGDFTIDELLTELCTLAAQALDVDGAGVMIVEGGDLRFIHAAPERVVQVEELQQVLQRGPCRDSMDNRAPVVIDDITKLDNWPEFAEASSTAGLRSCVAVPLLARGEAWGAIDVYRNARSTWTTEQVELVRLFAGLAAAYLVMASDRDLAGQARERLQHEATHDDLTGLPGRALMLTLVGHALAGARRHDTAVAVMYLDLDRFKTINDTLGHAAGDAVLVEAAHRMKGALRDNDVLARLAGDEFAIICEDLPRQPERATAELKAIGRRLGHALAPPMHVGDTDIVVSASVGAAVAGDHMSTDDILLEADHAMYEAKHQGRGTLVVAGPRPVAG